MNWRLALRRLPWYIAFCIILGPLILAPFTAGWSLTWYALYFVAPFVKDGMAWMVWGIPIAAGTLFWFVRVFLGFFWHYWLDDHFAT